MSGVLVLIATWIGMFLIAGGIIAKAKRDTERTKRLVRANDERFRIYNTSKLKPELLPSIEDFQKVGSNEDLNESRGVPSTAVMDEEDEDG